MNLALTPQPYQVEALLDWKVPILGVAAGKRSGKSHIMIVQRSLLVSSLQPGMSFVVASPTFGMTRRNLIPLYRMEAERMGLDIQGLDNKSPTELRIKWGDKVSTIHLDVTIENFGRMNGLSLAGVFVDEIDKARLEDAAGFLEEALIRLSKPALGHTAQLVVCGAPELNGYMAEFFLEKAGPDRKLYTWSMMSNQAISDDYKAAQLAQIPKSKQPGWIHGLFMFNKDGLVYDEYDPEENHTDLTLADLKPMEEVWVSWDLNDGGTSVVLFVRRGNHLIVLQEWMKMESTKHVIERVATMPWANRAILTCDPASTQIFPYLQEAKVKHGMRNKVMTSAPEIQWRVTAVNNRFGTSSFLADEGKVRRHLLINTKTCKTLNKSLMRQSYQRVGDKNIPDKKMWLEEAGTDISGPIDALGYGVFLHFPYNPRKTDAQVVLRH